MHLHTQTVYRYYCRQIMYLHTQVVTACKLCICAGAQFVIVKGKLCTCKYTDSLSLLLQAKYASAHVQVVNNCYNQ